MNSKEFYDTVVKMRAAQKEYFKTRSRQALQDSKELERAIDDEIRRVEDFFAPPQVKQMKMEFPD